MLISDTVIWGIIFFCFIYIFTFSHSRNLKNYSRKKKQTKKKGQAKSAQQRSPFWAHRVGQPSELSGSASCSTQAPDTSICSNSGSTGNATFLPATVPCSPSSPQPRGAQCSSGMVGGAPPYLDQCHTGPKRVMLYSWLYGTASSLRAEAPSELSAS